MRGPPQRPLREALPEAAGRERQRVTAPRRTFRFEPFGLSRSLICSRYTSRKEHFTVYSLPDVSSLIYRHQAAPQPATRGTLLKIAAAARGMIPIRSSSFVFPNIENDLPAPV